MAAIVGYVLGEKFTAPSVSELIVTAEGLVMARHTGEAQANTIIAPLTDLQRNWANLLDAAKLTEAERSEAMALFDKRVGKGKSVGKKKPPKPPPSVPPPEYHPPTSKN
jgi:hypothetical protein